MSNRTDPVSSGVSITPNDSTDLTVPTRAVYIGGTGDIVVTMDGTDVTFSNVPEGTLLPIVVTRIKATGTNATSILALS